MYISAPLPPSSAYVIYEWSLRSLPNGKERGKFLSLDLGGTNFRVIVMELTEESEFIMDNKVYAIPQDIMIGKKF